MSRVLSVFQIGWNINQDGPGNRLLFHLQGCNLRCPWCSNPEGVSLDGIMMVRKKFLHNSICPHGAITNQELDRTLCNNCKDHECLSSRRNKAISWSCHDMDTEEMTRLAVSSKALFFEGGGVTVTGGEATLQFDALKELFASLKNNDIDIALETNGTSKRLPELVPYVDHMILDVKHYDRNIAQKVVKNSLVNLESNLAYIAEKGNNPLIRITLIPGFNDSKYDAESFAAMFKRCGVDKRCCVEFLSYHEYGKIKWDEIGKDYVMPSNKISVEILNYYNEIFNSRGFEVVST